MAIWDLPSPPATNRRMHCSTWRSMGINSQQARCDNGRVELQITSAKGKHFYVVRYHGSIVRHGFAKSVTAAKRAARRQAGATGGVP